MWATLESVHPAHHPQPAVRRHRGRPVQCVGNSLAMLFSPTTSTAQWVGYQILIGAGRGMVFQVVRIRPHVRPSDEAPTATRLTHFPGGR